MAIAVGAFCKSTVFVLNKASEECTRDYEESEVEKDAEFESKGKFEKQNCDGPELDTPGLIQKSLDVAWFFNLISTKSTSPSVLSSTPLYLLYHNWKLDCLQ